MREVHVSTTPYAIPGAAPPRERPARAREHAQQQILS